MARLRYLFLVPFAVGAALVGVVVPAAAAFTAGTGAAMSVTSASLAPPTGLTATTSCNLLGGSTVTVTWTATTSTYATGYTAYLSANGGTPSPVSGSINGSATSATLPLNNLVRYTVTLRATYKSWTSAASAPSGTAWCL